MCLSLGGSQVTTMPGATVLHNHTGMEKMGHSHGARRSCCGGAGPMILILAGVFILARVLN